MFEVPRTDGGWLAGAVARAQATDPTFPRITIHDLRHTAASLAISAGANVKAVQRMLGHASAAMTLDTYADLFNDDLDAVAAALDRAKASAPVAKELPKHVAPTKRGLETPGNQGKTALQNSAGGGTRTHTPFRTKNFECSASAIPPRRPTLPFEDTVDRHPRRRPAASTPGPRLRSPPALLVYA